MEIIDELPVNARLYSLFEPRSYSLPRDTQPDPINDDFFHDLYLYKTPAGIIDHWRQAGYTHILVYERGMEFVIENPSNQSILSGQSALRETLQSLELVSQTPDKVYSIYRLP
jgi:hypothetical protein